jgi:hypothetical protein
MFANFIKLSLFIPIFGLMLFATTVGAQDIIGPGGQAEIGPDSDYEVVPSDSFEPLDAGPSGSGGVLAPDDERPIRREEPPPPSVDQLEAIAPQIKGSQKKKSMNEHRPQVEEITDPQQMRQWIMLDKMGEAAPPPPLPPPLPIQEVLFIEQPRVYRRAAPKDVTVNLPPVPRPERPIVGSCEFSSLLPIVLALLGYWFVHYRRRSLI